MKRSTANWAVLVFVGSTAFAALQCTPESAQAGPTGGQPTALARQWLMSDCFVDTEQQELIGAMNRHARDVALQLIAALDHGPPAALTAQLAQQRREQIQELRAELAAGTDFGLTAEQREIAGQALAVDAAAADPEFDRNYRLRALAGLGVLDDDAAREKLRAIADDANSPFRAAAQQALSKR